MIDQVTGALMVMVFVYFLSGLVMVIAYNAGVWIPKLSDNRKIRILTRCLMFFGWPIFLVFFIVESAVYILRAIWREIIF